MTMLNASRRMWRASPLTYIGLLIAVLISIFPFYFMFVIGTRTNDQIHDTPPPFTPSGNFGDNFGRVVDIQEVHFWAGLLNSLIVCVAITVSVLITSTLAGFAFAKLKFKGRNFLLLAVLATMMVPTQLGIIPLYGMFQDLGLFDNLLAVIIPFLTSAFGVFMMRQYASSAVSDELIEAARVDGCSTLRIYWSVVLPALRPAAGVLGLLIFMENWNSFLWPYAILQEHPTIQVSLFHITRQFYTDYSMVFAATSVATIPLVLVFIVFGRQIIGGLMEGAVKA